jgi:predicted RNase H-like nuclease
VDGCPSGWVCIGRALSGGAPQLRLLGSAAELFAQERRPAMLATDVPIGLPNAGSREADRAARKFLGSARCRSVFPAPVRPVLEATSYVEACEARRKADGRGRGISQQAWAIVPKIREVDALLRVDSSLQVWVREIHPEVSFAAWQGGIPMRYSKGRRLGRAERRELIEATYGSVGPLMAALPRTRVHVDDLFDAFAALWTAERIVSGTAATLPDVPPKDAVGLRMKIVY